MPLIFTELIRFATMFLRVRLHREQLPLGKATRGFDLPKVAGSDRKLADQNPRARRNRDAYPLVRIDCSVSVSSQRRHTVARRIRFARDNDPEDWALSALQWSLLLLAFRQTFHASHC